MTTLEWLQAKVEDLRENPTDECVEWPYSVMSRGYGNAKYQGQYILAHRLAFILHNGKDPKHYVCHTCDNPKCVNPAHLYDGTAKQNMADAIERNGFRPFGNGVGANRIHGILAEPAPGAGYKVQYEDKVRMISMYNAGTSYREIATHFDVVHSVVFHHLSEATNGKDAKDD